MLWVGVAGAAATVIGGAMSDKSAKKAGKEDRAQTAFMQQEEARLGRQDAIFNRQVDEHYVQKERAQRQRGLDEFRKFSTMGQFAPEIQDTGTRVAVPVLPGISSQPGGNIGLDYTPATLPPIPTAGGTP
jgi:hypothetical protein